MAAKVALTQRSLAGEECLGMAASTSSKSEDVSEAVSVSGSKITGQSRFLFRRLQQMKFICKKLKLVDME